MPNITNNILHCDKTDCLTTSPATMFPVIPAADANVLAKPKTIPE